MNTNLIKEPPEIEIKKEDIDRFLFWWVSNYGVKPAQAQKVWIEIDANDIPVMAYALLNEYVVGKPDWFVLTQKGVAYFKKENDNENQNE